MTEDTQGKEQFIFIYFYSRLRIDRDDIEDDLNELLADKGEVTGGGSGLSGSNIDIDIYEGSAADFLEPIRAVLRKLDVPADTVIAIDKDRFQVYE